MDDYSALAYRIAGGVADVRGCLILSRDGLILGSYPDDETAVKPAWVRFASLGDPERSFVEFGDQVWVYVRRPAYGAFAVANAGVRPGLVIDQLEGILTSAEESRNRRDTLRVPEASGGPPGKPPHVAPTSSRRTATRPSTPPAPDSAQARHWARAAQPAVDGEPAASAKEASGRGCERCRPLGGCDRCGGVRLRRGGCRRRPPANGAQGKKGAAGAEDTGERPAPTPEGDGRRRRLRHTNERNGTDKPPPMELDADAEVDPVMLAKEFSGLLQVESGDDEVSS